MLSLRHVNKSFTSHGHTVSAVADVSLDVQAGEFVAVQGPSGCGKSTLLLMAGGLLAPDSGEVCLQGENPYRLSPERRARLRAERVGFVFQQFHLIPYLNVRENVLAAGLAHNDIGVARADELLAQFGLSSRALHLPSELSIGERQRTALARALFNRPQILLADEPTGNLDPANAAIVWQHFLDFAAAGGAVLLVTHDANAAAVAGRRIALAAGRITTVTPSERSVG